MELLNYSKSKMLFFFFSAALGLHCRAWAFSGCGAQASHCSGFSCWGAQSPESGLNSGGTCT